LHEPQTSRSSSLTKAFPVHQICWDSLTCRKYDEVIHEGWTPNGPTDIGLSLSNVAVESLLLETFSGTRRPCPAQASPIIGHAQLIEDGHRRWYLSLPDTQTARSEAIRRYVRHVLI
jgi:hypothetical protein